MILPFLIAWVVTKINCHQGHVIAYLHEETRILKGKLKGKRIHLTDVERRRLALLAHPIDRKDLNDISTIATADTLQRWYRRLVVPSPSSTLRDHRLGRPRVSEEIEQLAVHMANENPTWGYRRIQGALSNVGYHIDKSTVRNMLRRHYIDPAPIRGSASTSWSQFIKLHFEVLEASVFFAAGWSPIRSLSATVIQIGRRLCAQGSPPLSLIRHGIVCLPAVVLQQWHTCWSACRSLFDIHYRLFTDRRPCTSGRVLPTLHLVASPSATLQFKTRPTERERDPPDPDALELAAVTRRSRYGRSMFHSRRAAASVTLSLKSHGNPVATYRPSGGSSINSEQAAA